MVEDIYRRQSAYNLKKQRDTDITSIFHIQYIVGCIESTMGSKELTVSDSDSEEADESKTSK